MSSRSSPRDISTTISNWFHVFLSPHTHTSIRPAVGCGGFSAYPTKQLKMPFLSIYWHLILFSLPIFHQPRIPSAPFLIYLFIFSRVHFAGKLTNFGAKRRAHKWKRHKCNMYFVCHVSMHFWWVKFAIGVCACLENAFKAKLKCFALNSRDSISICAKAFFPACTWRRSLFDTFRLNFGFHNAIFQLSLTSLTNSAQFNAIPTSKSKMKLFSRRATRGGKRGKNPLLKKALLHTAWR